MSPILSKIIFFILCETCLTLCPPLLMPQNSLFSANCRRYQRKGGICQIWCRNGFKQQGSPTRICQPNNHWSGRPSKCLSNAQQCQPIKQIQKGFVDNSCGDKFAVGCRLTFKCDTGSQLNGSQVIKCMKGGQWSNPKPRCDDDIPSKCIDLVAPLGGIWVNNDYQPYECNGQPGQTCRLICRQRFKLVGPTYVYCDIKTHVWSQPISTCVRY
ncbi:sushi, von Willebrand factor type A, EGF and pentraxin domain-containing protein 1-like [Oppia nitens]|uniref:sushi, von Willebrand factor type A, EGF and pentraxin domain-containing protein 1-like n=1 Tax=Oppia nitens TaxID=1686743 RepID=UPI0023DAA4C2|nr:sushi, von Willebrand factor type A, EGF and pentraxin domain-containing protein 1-like [Oppia nitens]